MTKKTKKTKTPEWGTYTLTVSKNGKVIKKVEYTGMSGYAMHDAAFSWRNSYPEYKGYKVDW